MVIKKYKSSLRDYVKTPSAWLIGIINKEAKARPMLLTAL